MGCARPWVRLVAEGREARAAWGCDRWRARRQSFLAPWRSTRQAWRPRHITRPASSGSQTHHSLAGSVRAVDGHAAALEGLRRARDLSAGLADQYPGPAHTRELAVAERELRHVEAALAKGSTDYS